MIPAMAGRLAIAIVAIAGCRSEDSAARDRLLGQLSDDAVAVVVAEGRAIAHPRIRGVLDVVASHWPPGMTCVVEAGFTSEQVGLSIDAASNITVLVATRADLSCAALSQREPGLWIATIGAGPDASATSVLDGERFARARSYLRTSPIAAVVLGDARIIAAAQPEPLEAWLAIDVAGAAGAAGAGSTSPAWAIADAITEGIGKLQADPSAAALAANLKVSRPGDTQVVVALDDAAGVDLAAAMRTALGWVDQRARPDPARFACPAESTGSVIACSNGTSFQVASLGRALGPIVAGGQVAPVVTDGAVTGLRLGAAVDALGLTIGDVVVAIDGRPVVSRAMFLQLLAQAHTEVTVTVRRGTTDKDLHFVER
jgi:hypothetical protein